MAHDISCHIHFDVSDSTAAENDGWHNRPEFKSFRVYECSEDI